MQKKRTANFREDETKLLIQLWGSPEIQSQLNASHRKAPIMLQIAAAMQHHGFYRTPEEVTTRIRNLKCIYHRIKKSQHMGVFGPETADWNHFPAIDAILGEHFVETNGDQFTRNIKKEPNDSETVDSVYNSNSACSGLEEDSDSGTPSPMQRLAVGSSHAAEQDESTGAINYALHSKRYIESDHDHPTEPKRRLHTDQHENDVSSLLRQLLDVEREHLELEKQRLELDRRVGSQLLTLVPIVSSILQRHQPRNRTDSVHEPSATESLQQAQQPLNRTESDRTERTSGLVGSLLQTCRPQSRTDSEDSFLHSVRTGDLVSKLFQTIPAPQAENRDSLCQK